MKNRVYRHHDCDLGYSKHAVVINNQLSKKVNNKNLAGAGVVFKFICAMDDYLFENKSSEFYDLVSLGNIADVMNLNEKETRYFAYKGIKEINNLFIKALMEHNSYDLENKYNIEKIGWVIAPKLNGTIRSGTQEEKLKMAEAFISNDYDFCLETARMCKNVKARQDTAVKSALRKILPQIHINESDRCIILDIGDTLSQSHTGLVAGKIADKFKLPTLLYRKVKDKKGFVGGSFRGISSISENLRLDILNSDLVEFSQGHALAGGVQLEESNVNKLRQYLNNLYKDKEPTKEKEYEVDLILEQDEIDNYIVEEICRYEDEWGNGLDVPLLVFKDMVLESAEIQLLGKKVKNIVFIYNGVKFIKKYAKLDLYNEMISKDKIRISVIGKCVNNIYNNNTYAQVEIVDMEITNI